MSNEAQERLMRNPHTLEKLRQAERDLKNGEGVVVTAADLRESRLAQRRAFTELRALDEELGLEP